MILNEDKLLLSEMDKRRRDIKYCQICIQMERVINKVSCQEPQKYD